MNTGNTSGEKLARIEAQLERLLSDVAAIKEAQDNDIAALAAMKNRGAGLLAGVGLFGSIIGALFIDKLHHIGMWFMGSAK